MQTETKSIQTAVKFFMIHFATKTHATQTRMNTNIQQYIMYSSWKVIKLLIINDIII